MSAAACSPLALALSATSWAYSISDTRSAHRAGSAELASAIVKLDFLFLLDFLEVPASLLVESSAQLVDPLPA
jgi:hypothetical protein